MVTVVHQGRELGGVVLVHRQLTLLAHLHVVFHCLLRVLLGLLLGFIKELSHFLSREEGPLGHSHQMQFKGADSLIVGVVVPSVVPGAALIRAMHGQAARA